MSASGCGCVPALFRRENQSHDHPKKKRKKKKKDNKNEFIEVNNIQVADDKEEKEPEKDLMESQSPMVTETFDQEKAVNMSSRRKLQKQKTMADELENPIEEEPVVKKQDTESSEVIVTCYQENAPEQTDDDSSTGSTNTGSTTIAVVTRQLDSAKLSSPDHQENSPRRENGVWSPSTQKRSLRLDLSQVKSQGDESASTSGKESPTQSSTRESSEITEDPSPSVWQPFGAPSETPQFRSVKLDTPPTKAPQQPSTQKPKSPPATEDTKSPSIEQNGKGPLEKNQNAIQAPVTQERKSTETKPTVEINSEANSKTVTSTTTSATTSWNRPGRGINLPPSQSPTITLLQKAREGQIPKGAIYIDEKIHEDSRAPPIPRDAVLIDQKVTVEGDKIHTDSYYAVPTSISTGDVTTHILKAPPKYEGIGPTECGIPVSLRTAVKDEYASDWYKTMYRSLHKATDDPRSHMQTVHLGGYMSEPEYDRRPAHRQDYATMDYQRKPDRYLSLRETQPAPKSPEIRVDSVNEDLLTDGIISSRQQDTYRNQPRSIAEYEPGHSSLADREFQKFWDDFWDSVEDLNEHFRHSPRPQRSYEKRWPNSLLCDGYESDSTLIRKTVNPPPRLDPEQQKAWYKEIQKGGDIPLTGLRKPAPEKPKAAPGCESVSRQPHCANSTSQNGNLQNCRLHSDIISAFNKHFCLPLNVSHVNAGHTNFHFLNCCCSELLKTPFELRPVPPIRHSSKFLQISSRCHSLNTPALVTPTYLSSRKCTSSSKYIKEPLHSSSCSKHILENLEFVESGANSFPDATIFDSYGHMRDCSFNNRENIERELIKIDISSASLFNENPTTKVGLIDGKPTNNPCFECHLSSFQSHYKLNCQKSTTNASSVVTYEKPLNKGKEGTFESCVNFSRKPEDDDVYYSDKNIELESQFNTIRTSCETSDFLKRGSHLTENRNFAPDNGRKTNCRYQGDARVERGYRSHLHQMKQGEANLAGILCNDQNDEKKGCAITPFRERNADLITRDGRSMERQQCSHNITSKSVTDNLLSVSGCAKKSVVPRTSITCSSNRAADPLATTRTHEGDVHGSNTHSSSAQDEFLQRFLSDSVKFAHSSTRNGSAFSNGWRLTSENLKQLKFLQTPRMNVDVPNFSPGNDFLGEHSKQSLDRLCDRASGGSKTMHSRSSTSEKMFQVVDIKKYLSPKLAEPKAWVTIANNFGLPFWQYNKTQTFDKSKRSWVISRKCVGKQSNLNGACPLLSTEFLSALGSRKIQDPEMYQQYIAAVLHSISRSQAFTQLQNFYENLEKAASDVPDGAKRNATKFLKWRRENDRSLNVRHASVEDLRQVFQKPGLRKTCHSVSVTFQCHKRWYNISVSSLVAKYNKIDFLNSKKCLNRKEVESDRKSIRTTSLFDNNGSSTLQFTESFAGVASKTIIKNENVSKNEESRSFDLYAHVSRLNKLFSTENFPPKTCEEELSFEGISQNSNQSVSSLLRTERCNKQHFSVSSVVENNQNIVRKGIPHTATLLGQDVPSKIHYFEKIFRARQEKCSHSISSPSLSPLGIVDKPPFRSRPLRTVKSYKGVQNESSVSHESRTKKDLNFISSNGSSVLTHEVRSKSSRYFQSNYHAASRRRNLSYSDLSDSRTYNRSFFPAQLLNCFRPGYVPERTVSFSDLRDVSLEKVPPYTSMLPGPSDDLTGSSRCVANSTNVKTCHAVKKCEFGRRIGSQNFYLTHVRSGSVAMTRQKFESMESLASMSNTSLNTRSIHNHVEKKRTSFGVEWHKPNDVQFPQCESYRESNHKGDGGKKNCSLFSSTSVNSVNLGLFCSENVAASQPETSVKLSCRSRSVGISGSGSSPFNTVETKPSDIGLQKLSTSARIRNLITRFEKQKYLRKISSMFVMPQISPDDINAYDVIRSCDHGDDFPFGLSAFSENTTSASSIQSKVDSEPVQKREPAVPILTTNYQISTYTDLMKENKIFPSDNPTSVVPVIREDERCASVPRNNQLVASTVQSDGRSGLDKEEHPESQHQYQETEVNIHFKSPIRNLEKEYIEEEELRKRQEDAMRRFYAEERQKKQMQQVAEIEMRRHSDNFTPSQKSPIPLNRYDNPFESSYTLKHGSTIEYPRTLAQVLYPFVAQSTRELSLSKGDIVYINRQIDKNWYEGEHHGFVGIFPVSYVAVIPTEKANLQPKKAFEGHGIVKYTFRAKTPMELSVFKGERVILTRRVDQNWYEGRIGSKKGILPVAYIDVLQEPGDSNIRGELTVSPKPPASPVYSPLINGNPYKPATSPTYVSSSASLQKSQLPDLKSGDKLSLTQSLHVDTYNEPIPYRSLYSYHPQNDDELELREGDTVYVMEKCDDGWYVGTSLRTGLFGTFPGNYVERI